jgi:hypothetical protein
LKAPLQCSRPSLIAWRGRALRLIRAFQLVILRRCQEQFLDRRRSIVDRRIVDADDLIVVCHLIVRAQLEPGDAASINAHEVQAMGRHLDRDLLPRTAITAVEQ